MEVDIFFSPTFILGFQIDPDSSKSLKHIRKVAICDYKLQKKCFELCFESVPF
jgi:hypothetical protein